MGQAFRSAARKIGKSTRLSTTVKTKNSLQANLSIHGKVDPSSAAASEEEVCQRERQGDLSSHRFWYPDGPAAYYASVDNPERGRSFPVDGISLRVGFQNAFETKNIVTGTCGSNGLQRESSPPLVDGTIPFLSQTCNPLSREGFETGPCDENPLGQLGSGDFVGIEPHRQSFEFLNIDNHTSGDLVFSRRHDKAGSSRPATDSLDSLDGSFHLG